MTNHNCASEILKPFQSILNALALRKKHEEFPVDYSRSMKMQMIRTRTTRPFRIWDRLRESLSNPETMAAEVQLLAQSLTLPTTTVTRNEAVDSFTDLQAAPPTQSAVALARAKTTSTRLRSLEIYLEESNPTQTVNG